MKVSLLNAWLENGLTTLNIFCLSFRIDVTKCNANEPFNLFLMSIQKQHLQYRAANTRCVLKYKWRHFYCIFGRFADSHQKICSTKFFSAKTPMHYIQYSVHTVFIQKSLTIWFFKATSRKLKLHQYNVCM